MKASDETFAVLIKVKIVIVERVVADFVKYESEEASTAVIGKVINVFFTLPDSAQKTLFINCEERFTYDDNPKPINSMLFPGKPFFLDQIGLPNIFSHIEFERYKRKDWVYLCQQIERGYIPLFGPKLNIEHHKFEL